MVPQSGFTTRSEARGRVFEWIEAIYNRQRLHSTLGNLPTALFESKTKVS
jgi:transposase InsO family protein